jgi:molecular chaperone Hsp33
VRLGETVDYVLRAHAYPGPVSGLLGELLVLAGALAGGPQVRRHLQPPGPRRRAGAAAGRRLHERRPDARLRRLRRGRRGRRLGRRGRGGAAPLQLLGRGLLALTVDQRATGGEAYQGIVDLEGQTLSDCMSAYFERSEQVPTAIRTALGRDPLTDRWQAGAIMVQATPGSRPGDSDAAGDHWDRTRLMLGTATDIELLDPALPARRPAVPPLPRGRRARLPADAPCARLRLRRRPGPQRPAQLHARGAGRDAPGRRRGHRHLSVL